MLAWCIAQIGFIYHFEGRWKRAVTGAGYLECSYTSFFPLGFSVTAWFFKALWVNYLCSSVLLPFLVPNVDCDINRIFSWYCCLCICGTVIENLAYQYIIDPSKLHLHSLTIIASFFYFQKTIWCFRLHHSALKLAIMSGGTCSCDLLCAYVIADMTTLAMAHLLAR